MMEQKKERRDREVFSVKHMLLLLGILAILAAGIWGYNLFRLKNIRFDGLTRYSEEEFINKLDLLHHLRPLSSRRCKVF